MGYISDCTRLKKLGRRHLYILIGSIGLALSNFLLWSISPNWTGKTKILILFICLFAIKTFSTIYVTPYTALGAELTNDYNEQNLYQSIKTIFFSCRFSLCYCSSVSSILQAYSGISNGPKILTYPVMGFYTSLIILILALVCFFVTKSIFL